MTNIGSISWSALVWSWNSDSSEKYRKTNAWSNDNMTIAMANIDDSYNDNEK